MLVAAPLFPPLLFVSLYDPAGWEAAVLFLLSASVSLFLLWATARQEEDILEAAARRMEALCGKRGDSCFEGDPVVAAAERCLGRAAEAEQALKSLESAVSATNDGIVLLDGQGRVIFCNQAAASLLGADMESVIGRDIAALVREPDFISCFQQAVASRAAAECSSLLHPGGRESRTILFRLLPLAGARSSGAETALVMVDLTELRRLEESRQEFFTNVSHELKTPVTAIKGYVETLLDGALEEPDVGRRFLGIVARQTGRLEALIEDILLLSQVETASTGGLPPGAGVVEVADVLESVLEACQFMAFQKGVTVEFTSVGGLKVRGHAGLLGHAVSNLLTNAIKYSPGGRQVVVRARPVERGGVTRVAVEVEDQGPGIPAEHIPRIFERFYRVDKARSRELGGTGLGLAIVKHVVLAHGGEVEVESEVGKGSLFRLVLPAA